MNPHNQGIQNKIKDRTRQEAENDKRQNKTSDITR